MADTLFLRLQATDLEWVEYDGFGREVACASGTDDDFRGAYPGGFGGDIIVVVPGEDVLLTSAKVPSRQHRQIVQAAPYVVEEELAADVESCFFAIGPHLADGSVSVSVVDDALMKAWRARLAELDVLAPVMVSENELVAGAEPARVVVDGDRVHVGSITHRGLTLPVDSLPLAVSLIDHEGLQLFASAEARESLSIALSELAAAGEKVEEQAVIEDGFKVLVSFFDGTKTNLLQGRYRVEAKKASGSIWRSVAILAGIAFALHLMMLAGQGWYLSTRASQYEDEALALYKSVFPNDRNVRDVRRRWNSHIGRSGGPEGNPFLALFSQSSRGMEGAGLTLQNVNFNESRGDLILQVTGPRSETLVQYSQQLVSQGLDAEIGTISQEDGGVRGSIKVRVRGA